ncbi:hypothetical protein [Rheinheimera sp.]|uniref:hypothetical protein n=1 Tax=Rheinheimera sp. TaxID=1869214 RepID=UPI0037CA5FB5
MNDVTHSQYAVQVWLGNFISAQHASELERVRQIPGVHPRCLYLFTRQGSGGFTPLYSIEQQAFCQFLAHRGCVLSSLLFGYSLSMAYRESRRIICMVSAYQYVFWGIEGMLQCSLDQDFLSHIAPLLDDPLLYLLCEFLLHKRQALGFEQHQYHPIIEFCQALTLNTSTASKLH